MAIVSILSNHYKYQKAKKQIDLSADTIIAILMVSAFVFDKDAHATLADVTASQLATGNGYTQDNKALVNQVLTEDDGNNQAIMVADDVTWTAAGGSIGPFGAVCFIDTTTADDTLIGCSDLGEDITVADLSSYQLQNISIAEG